LLFFARLNRRRKRFVPRKIVFVRIHHTQMQSYAEAWLRFSTSVVVSLSETRR
jgi:hypothetical protein